MKKILTFVALTFVIYNGFSQHIRYGIGAGLNYSSLVVSNFPDKDSKYKLGFQINAVIDLNLNDKIGLRAEPGFVNRGTALSYPGQSDSKINLNYISVPVLFKCSPIDKLSLLAGPEFAYRITAKAVTNSNTIDVKSIYDGKFDVAINAGLSYRFFDKLDIGIRYNRGFISTVKDLIFTDQYGNENGKATLYNQGFTFSITYMIK